MKGQWGRLAGYFVATLLVSGILTIGLPFIGGRGWLPELITREGRAIDQLFWGLTILSVVIFAVVAAIVIYSITHFRAEPGDMSDGEHIHGNARMELAWIIIPSIIVFAIAVVSYVVLADNEIGLYYEEQGDEAGAATMEIDVRAFSFGWGFRHRDGDGNVVGGTDEAPAAELVVPVGEVIQYNVVSCSGKERIGRLREQARREHAAHGGEVRFGEIKPSICERVWDLTTTEDREQAVTEARQLEEIEDRRADGERLSAEDQALWDSQPEYRGDRQYIDVNHAFWVPEARLKIDAVAGLRTFVQWKPTRVTRPEDRFQVVCAELCGTGHNAMRTDMCVVDGETYRWWLDLDAETRTAATCAHLRLFSCVDEIGDRDELLDAATKLVEEQPDAECATAEEALA